MIRPYASSDLPALRGICLLTGRAGADATGAYTSDELLPDVFLEPFVTLEPSTAWVVDVGSPRSPQPVGYLIGVLDTAAFVQRWRSEWTPEFARRHARTAVRADDQWLLDFGYEPEWMLIPQLDRYPAHLHIDLLPAAQGGGWGRRLMQRLGAAALEAGAPGIHLGLDPANAGALAFYTRLGFERLASPDDALVLGIDPALLVCAPQSSGERTGVGGA